MSSERNLISAVQEQNIFLNIADFVVVGGDPAFVQVLSDAKKLAVTKLSVLIQGETGSGKEIFARTIHHLSKRRGGPLETLSCGSIPPELLENELFGHLPGAYTNATGTQEGIIGRAEGGTIFFDEIQCLPLGCQEKLLQVLDTGFYRLLGGGASRKADIRVVCASNKDLMAEVKAERFREDLYYRIAESLLVVPPLRVRRSDILVLAEFFLAAAHAQETTQCTAFSKCAEEALLAFEWPGNVRQLKSTVEKAAALADGKLITAENLQLPSRPKDPRMLSLAAARRANSLAFDREYVELLFKATRGSISDASAIAGRERSSLYRLARRLGIDIDRYRGSSSK